MTAVVLPLLPVANRPATSPPEDFDGMFAILRGDALDDDGRIVPGQPLPLAALEIE